MSLMLTPLLRALGQLDDRILWGVVLRSVGWAILCGVGLHLGALWLVHWLVDAGGVLAWAADIVASVGASVIAVWFFVPVAAAIATFYVDRIARAVERRYYPDLPPAAGAPLHAQAADGIVLGARLAGLALLGLVLILLIPGIGLFCAWAITGYALGRGLFVAVAMRRMARPQAAALYRRHRGRIVAQGMILAVAGWVPLFNLLMPVVAAAAMVHVLDMILSSSADHRYPQF